MSQFDDSVLIAFHQGLNGYYLVEVEFHYGKNPLDLIGEPEAPRVVPPNHSIVATKIGVEKHLIPYVKGLANFYEIRAYTTNHIIRVSGSTSLVTGFWNKLITDCFFVPLTT